MAITYGTKGMMGVDYEKRIDFDKMRKDRVAKIHAAMEKTDLGCLVLFDSGNKRYATSTAVASPEVDNMGRYAIIPRNGDPYLFHISSEGAVQKENCPWLKDRIFPAHTTMFGALPREWGLYEGFFNDLYMVMDENGIDRKAPVGIDILDGQLVTLMIEKELRIGDGQEVMQDATTIKTDEEIMLMRHAASIVDAAFYKVAQSLRPGTRENEIQAVAAHEMHRLGAQWAINIQVTSGTRTHPHPHLSSDRIIRPGELVFADMVLLYNGYHTCYYRTLCCGEPTQKQKDIYKSAYEMLRKGIEAAQVGNTTADVIAAWPSCDHWGFKNESESFALAFAHGLGTTLWQRPMIQRAFSVEHPVELKEGMVLAFETYDGEGYDGARIESEVVITEDGPEIISQFPSSELIACPIL